MREMLLSLDLMSSIFSLMPKVKNEAKETHTSQKSLKAVRKDKNKKYASYSNFEEEIYLRECFGYRVSSISRDQI